MSARPQAVSTITTQDLLERYVDEDYRASRGFHPAMDDFYIARLEEFRAAIQLPTKPHRRHVHLFVFLTAGSMEVTCDLQRIQIGAGEAHLALAHQVAIVEKMSEDACGFYCHFSLETIIQLYHREHMLAELSVLSKGMRARAVSLCGPASATVEAMLNRLREEYIGGQDLRLIDAYLVAVCYEMKAALVQRSDTRSSPRAYEIAEAFKRLAHEHAREQKPIAFYAEALGISPNHLNKCVRQAAGTSASAILTDAVMLEAKLMLRHAELSVAEIAYHLGFTDPAYFSRAFRTHIGRTPRAYRVGGGATD